MQNFDAADALNVGKLAQATGRCARQNETRYEILYRFLKAYNPLEEVLV
jgi:hypothetical protein